MKLQIVGIATGHDRTVVRGDTSGPFSVFCFRGDQLLGIETINRPADHMVGRRLIANDLFPSHEQVADLSFDLKAFSAARKQPVESPAGDHP